MLSNPHLRFLLNHATKKEGGVLWDNGRDTDESGKERTRKEGRREFCPGDLSWFV